ncbi:cytochrome c oxidase assembly protein [Actinomadura sp. NAK00032]|uniref:cytochrome c oxidase assembly protein n=1 Tax=Actinomadura sp. NAK00032 TaxID=2742128 RepID=UPI001590B45E|nr:cytochrome c oxidase assembly protein [Actinomadura sp. NAK00032]QKW35589.1 cytochrome c oxidase assembly protein [Actinomadura sp. NAK00032]
MHHPPGPAHDGGGWGTVLAVAGVAALAVAYLLLAHRGSGRARPRDRWRTAMFLTGCALLAVALLPPIAPLAHEDFRGHMLQHMLLGMYAPLALVLGAPLTVLLRALPTDRARELTGALRSRPMAFLAHPIVALTLSTGSLAVLYFTPLYDATTTRPALHWLMHAHFVLSGFLFAWVIAGPDPAPSRPRVNARLLVLGAAIALHAVIAQLMYGGFLTDVDAPIAEVRGGAEIMYYGGDIAELLLAAALVATWRPARRTAPVRRRPSPAPAPAAAVPRLRPEWGAIRTSGWWRRR